MKRVMVRYTVKAGRAAENERYVEQVFAELARVAPTGVKYAVFRMEDGVTFVHLYAHESSDDAGLLSTLEAFKAFRAGLNDRCEVAPVRTVLDQVGSYSGESAVVRGIEGSASLKIATSR